MSIFYQKRKKKKPLTLLLVYIIVKKIKMIVNLLGLEGLLGIMLIIVGIGVMIYDDDHHKIRGQLITLTGALTIAAYGYFVITGGIVLWNI